MTAIAASLPELELRRQPEVLRSSQIARPHRAPPECCPCVRARWEATAPHSSSWNADSAHGVSACTRPLCFSTHQPQTHVSAHSSNTAMSLTPSVLPPFISHLSCADSSPVPHFRGGDPQGHSLRPAWASRQRLGRAVGTPASSPQPCSCNRLTELCPLPTDPQKFQEGAENPRTWRRDSSLIALWFISALRALNIQHAPTTKRSIYF